MLFHLTWIYKGETSFIKYFFSKPSIFNIRNHNQQKDGHSSNKIFGPRRSFLLKNSLVFIFWPCKEQTSKNKSKVVPSLICQFFAFLKENFALWNNFTKSQLFLIFMNQFWGTSSKFGGKSKKGAYVHFENKWVSFKSVI